MTVTCSSGAPCTFAAYASTWIGAGEETGAGEDMAVIRSDSVESRRSESIDDNADVTLSSAFVSNSVAARQ